MIPEISITQTSNIAELYAYDPIKEKINTDGHKNLFGINVTYEKNLAPTKPIPKKAKLANNICLLYTSDAADD